MIKGIGTDIVKVSRIREMIGQHSDKFLDRVFTQEEIRKAAGLTPPFEYFAGRWAAKEAFSKALGTGIGERCAWQDISITGGENEPPAIKISGRAAETARLAGIDKIHLSISHEKEYALAFVVVEGGV